MCAAKIDRLYGYIIILKNHFFIYTLQWSDELPVLQVRIARQIDQLKEIVKFYTEGLGLIIIGNFENHAGYDGVMIGLPDIDYHMEFISHKDGSPGKAPTKENLLAFYFDNPSIVDEVASRLTEIGSPQVIPENPYWLDISKTIEDPDGWRVVLVGSKGFSKK